MSGTTLLTEDVLIFLSLLLSNLSYGFQYSLLQQPNNGIHPSEWHSLPKLSDMNLGLKIL